VRGARGLELELDLAGLQAVSLAIPTPSLPEWDWARWLGAWRRRGAAKQAQDAAAAAAAARDGDAPAPAKDGENDGGEKLSVFFDWVAEQLPADPLARVSARVTGGHEARWRAQGACDQGQPRALLRRALPQAVRRGVVVPEYNG
jgi:hypothetical protein